MCNGVVFTFGQGRSGIGDSVRDGLIRSIIFSISSSNQNAANAHGVYNMAGLPGGPTEHKFP